MVFREQQQCTVNPKPLFNAFTPASSSDEGQSCFFGNFREGNGHVEMKLSLFPSV